MTAIQDLGVKVIQIPGGFTGLLQPLDVGLKKPFKVRVRASWEELMMAMIDNHGVVEAPTRDDNGQCRLLDHLALVLCRKDLATNTNERVLLEGVTTDGMLLAMPSSISTDDAEYIDRLFPRVLDSQGIGEH